MRCVVSLSSLTLLMTIGCTPQPAVDVDAERTALMDTDRNWVEAFNASDSPADIFADQFLDDGSLLPPDAPLAQGREAVRAVIAALVEMPGFAVTWTPTAADVGSGGDLGFTRGTYEMHLETPEGAVTINGKYLTVWKKQADGTWMVTADTFNADGPPTPSM